MLAATLPFTKGWALCHTLEFGRRARERTSRVGKEGSRQRERSQERDEGMVDRAPSEPHELVIPELHRPPPPPRHERERALLFTLQKHGSGFFWGSLLFLGRKISWEILPRRF